MTNWRTSSYTIYVDLPGDSSRILLVHGYTGAYDLVNRNVAGYLRARELGRAPKPLFGTWASEPDLPADDTEPSPQTLVALKRRGYLTVMSAAEEEARFTDVATGLHEAASRRPDWIFMPTYDCNLRCFYCFQDHLRGEHADARLSRTMRPELVDRIFSAMRDIEAGLGGAGALSPRIGFFGGEPLLAASRPIIEYIMDSARSEGSATFWAVTNGTELRSYEDLLGPDGIGLLQITLDGPASEHDQRRVHPDGSGSFEAIADGISLALDRGVSVQVRVNVDRANLSLLPAIADELTTRGWSDQKGFRAYASPVRAANGKIDRSTTFNSWQLDVAIAKMRATHPELAVIGRPDDRLRSAALGIFQNSGAPPLRAEFCGAHSGTYIFDALGDIYACWERTGDSRIRIGQVTAEGTARLRTAMESEWRSRSVAVVGACRRCRYALHCGGGCAVLAEDKRGVMHTNHCDAYATRFRAMVAEAFLAHATAEDVSGEPGQICGA